MQSRLPSGAKPALGPDATGVGWIYQYALTDRSGRHDLADLRALQDWFLKYELKSVLNVAEVALVGGMVRQYQVALDPDRLRAYNLPQGGGSHPARQSGKRRVGAGTRRGRVRGAIVSVPQVAGRCFAGVRC